jgi:hypothetical protein
MKDKILHFSALIALLAGSAIVFAEAYAAKRVIPCIAGQPCEVAHHDVVCWRYDINKDGAYNVIDRMTFKKKGITEIDINDDGKYTWYDAHMFRDCFGYIYDVNTLVIVP